MRQLIHQIKTQCIFSVTKVYFSTSMTTTTNNIQMDSLPEMGHPCHSGLYRDGSLQESVQ